MSGLLSKMRRSALRLRAGWEAYVQPQGLKRPLLPCVCAMVPTLFLLCGVLPGGAAQPIGLLSAALCLSLFLGRQRARLFTPFLLALGVLLASLTAHINDRYVYRPVAALAPASYRISGYASEFARVYTENTAVVLTVDRLDGAAVRPFSVMVYLDGELPLSPGQRISFRGRLELPRSVPGYDRLRYFQTRHIFLAARAQGELEITPLGAVPLRLLPLYWAKSFAGLLRAIVPDDDAAVLVSLILGDTSGLPEDYLSALRDTGLSHIMAVSGMNVSFLVGVFLLCFRRRLGTALSIPALLVFVLMVGAGASVLRAAIMQLIFLLSFLFRRENDPLNSLFAALFLMLLCNPYGVYDASLWLSFFATLGLIVAGAPLQRLLMTPFAGRHRLIKAFFRFFCGALSSTLTAQAFVLPLQIYLFGEISLAAPLANLLVAWAVQFSFLLGMLGAVLALIWLPLGQALGHVLRVLVDYQQFLVPRLAALPFSVLSASSGYVLIGVSALYAFAGMHFWFRRGKRLPAAAALLTLSLCLTAGLAQIDADRSATAAFLDTGGGQSVVLLQKGVCVVVGCGGVRGASETLLYLRDQNVRRVDILILPDYKSATCGGAEEFMRTLPVKLLAVSQPPTEAAEELKTLLSGLAEETLLISSPAVLETGALSMTLLPAGEGGFDANRLAAAFTLAGRRFLLPGSIGPERLSGLLSDAEIPPADIVFTGDYYAARSLPANAITGQHALCLLPGYRGADEKTLRSLAAQGIYGVDLYESGHVILRFTDQIP